MSLKLFTCRNKACKRPIASTDGGRLYVADLAIISNKVQYACVHCDFFSYWLKVGTPCPELPEIFPQIYNPYEDNPLLVALVCPHCHAQNGLQEQSGLRLYLGGMMISYPITYLCRHCQKETKWRPAPLPIKRNG